MKNRCAAMLLVLMLVFLFSACANGDESKAVSEAKTVSKSQTVTDIEDEETVEVSESKTAQPETGKILVVCFSATGNTKPIAGYVAEALGADLYEIVPAVPYTDEDLNYNDSSARATKEQNDPSARPEISGTVENMDQYDTVVIAHPIWWGKEPKIIDTFMESYDFTGKTLTSCCTSGGSGIESSVSNLKCLAANANWLKSRRFEIGADSTDIEDWLVEIGLK